MTGIGDIGEMLLNKRRWLKAANALDGKALNVLMIGGYTKNELMDWLKIFLSEHGMKSVIRDHGWGGIRHLLSSLYSEDLVGVDVVVLLPYHDEVVDYSPFDFDENDKAAYFNSLRRLYELCGELGVSVIQVDIVAPYLCRHNQKEIGSMLRRIGHYNDAMLNMAHEYSHVVMCYASYLAARVGLGKWYDRRNWAMYGDQLHIHASMSFSRMMCAVFVGMFSAPKKVLILDLDNTLWGGVVGDDGVENLKIGPDSGEGRIFYEFQRYLVGLKQSGVILALCSKNEKNVALEAFGLDGMLLKIDDFACVKIGWDNKSKYISEIVDELNLGLNSVVFVDDNPVERAEVRSALPVVSVPEVGDDVLGFIDVLEGERYFYSNNAITEEDISRAETYLQNKARMELKDSAGDDESYLMKLKTVLTIKPVDETNIERTMQLFNKTNQFNTTTLRVAPSDVDVLMSQEQVFCVSASDVYGKYGIISAFRTVTEDGVLMIRNWVLSCRVFKRGIEEAVFDWLLIYCKANKIYEIKAEYVETTKNRVVSDLYERLGFVLQPYDGDDSRYKYKFLVPEVLTLIKTYCEVSCEN